MARILARIALVGLCLLAFALPLQTAHAAGNIYYVTSTGTGTSCSSWADADACSNLQTAINKASAGDQVWVAAGTYSAPQAGFTLSGGISLYGGFAGEDSPSKRDLVNNVT